MNIAPKIGVEKKLTMHIVRHMLAQHATNIIVRTLQKLFRHTKFETTERLYEAVYIPGCRGA